MNSYHDIYLRVYLFAMYSDLKITAIQLRKEGLTYSEIMRQVPIAKSTLSGWLHSVSLARYQQQRLTEKKLAAGRRGGEARKRERITRMTKIIEEACSSVSNISMNELKLIGATLYWAEGTKEKSYKTGYRVVFTNSDPRMITLFLSWTEMSLGVAPSRVFFSLYIHETQVANVSSHIEFWKRSVDMKYNTLQRVYFKKNKLSTKRKNIGDEYHGQLRVEISRSTDLNRRITGLIEGIFLKCPVV